MSEPESRAELRAIVARGGDTLPLDRSLLLSAQEEYPGIAIDDYLATLDDLARRARHRAESTGDLAGALRQTLFVESAFRGNEENYYDPKNSMLNEVLDRRLGIPITLSIVYIEVARRAGARAVGVGFPGHFLVRHDLEDRSVLIDPFNKGAIVRRADCEALLRRVSGGATELEPWMLAPASPRSIAIRVLTNLKHAYMLLKDHVGAIRAIDRLLIFEPERWSELRDRGLLFAELECASAAVRDLEEFLVHATPGRDVELVRRVLPGLRKKIAQLN